MNTLIKSVVLRLSLVTGLLAALVVPAAAQTGDQTAETGSYGYLRVVEGKATLTPADGESAVGSLFVKRSCALTDAQRNFKVTLRANYFRKSGQSGVNPQLPAQLTQGQFESSARLELYDPRYVGK